MLNIKLLLFTSIIIDYCSSHLNNWENVDFAVIGAGTAGCIVATRLVEQGYNVVVLEAGKEPPLGTDTARVYVDFIETEVDWQFTTEPQEHALFAHPDRRTLVSAGKMMGGSGSFNVMFFLRGAKHDYDKWEQLGAKGWNYTSILPYIKKLEK
ncbi:glucose dehydrogenase-like [FAD: quinone], partial [Leptotrombidium deliense]